MPACALRYRLDGSGPAVYLVECEERYHVYTRGALGAALPDSLMREIVSQRRGGRWVPVEDGTLNASPAQRQVTAKADESASWAPIAVRPLGLI